MREFIYLDTDFLESYLAQLYKGLEIGKQVEEAAGTSYMKGTTEKTFKGEANAETGKIVGLFAKVEGTLGVEIRNAPESITSSESGKQLITKQLKDFMFNEFYQSIVKINPFVTTVEAMIPGAFIEYAAKFDYIDFDRVSTLYSEENRQIYVSQIGESTPGNFTYDEFERIRKRIVFFKQTIPYDALMYANDLLILLKERFLREGKGQLGFKFSGRMTIVGKVNKKVPDPTVNRSGIIATLNDIQCIAFEMLKELGFVSKSDLLIVTPIAAFYESVP